MRIGRHADRMPLGPRLIVSRLWRPAGVAPGDARLASHRLLLARLVVIVVELFCFFVLLPVLLAARFIFHLPVPSRLLVAAFVTGVAANGAIQVTSVCGLAGSGQWRALDGRILLRADHPRAFWIWIVIQTLVAAAWFFAAGFLAWVLPR